MDPSLEWPVGNPARERIFRLHEVSEELAGILSIDARHVPLSPEAVGKRARGVGRRAVFSGREGTNCGEQLERGNQALIAAISGSTPKIVIIRLRL